MNTGYGSGSNQGDLSTISTVSPYGSTSATKWNQFSFVPLSSAQYGINVWGNYTDKT